MDTADDLSLRVWIAEKADQRIYDADYFDLLVYEVRWESRSDRV